MTTYLLLLNWTDQGIRNIKESPKRLGAAKNWPKTSVGRSRLPI